MNVLLLGATSAVAAEVARLYRDRGARLYLLGRSEEKLGKLVGELGDAVVGQESVDFLERRESVIALERALRLLEVVDVVVIAQGDLGDQRRSEQDLEEAERQVRLNFLSVVWQLVVLGPFFERQERGAICVISSVAGDRGRPRNYTYGAAKAGVTVYLQGLRSRLWPKVLVTTIKLGPVDTPMTANHEKNALFTTSRKAAQGIVHAIDRRRAEVYLPSYWCAILYVVRHLPEVLFQRLKFLSGR